MKKDDYLLNVGIGEVTQEQIALATEQVAVACKRGRFDGGVVDWMLEQRTVTPDQVLRAKAAHFGCEMVHLRIPDDVIAKIPAHIAWKHRVVPVEFKVGILTVAIEDPTDLDALEVLAMLTKGQFVIKITTEEELDWAIRNHYPSATFKNMGIVSVM